MQALSTVIGGAAAGGATVEEHVETAVNNYDECVAAAKMKLSGFRRHSLEDLVAIAREEQDCSKRFPAP